MYRITVFVPPDHVDRLLDAVVEEVPLLFGPYDRSAWWSAIGVEQFRPLPGSSPTVGTAGKTERVQTVRLEFAIPHDEELVQKVLRDAVIPNHPWQEPAIFVDETRTTASHLSGT